MASTLDTLDSDQRETLLNGIVAAWGWTATAEGPIVMAEYQAFEPCMQTSSSPWLREVIEAEGQAGFADRVARMGHGQTVDTEQLVRALGSLLDEVEGGSDAASQLMGVLRPSGTATDYQKFVYYAASHWLSNRPDGGDAPSALFHVDASIREQLAHAPISAFFLTAVNAMLETGGIDSPVYRELLEGWVDELTGLNRALLQSLNKPFKECFTTVAIDSEYMATSLLYLTKFYAAIPGGIFARDQLLAYLQAVASRRPDVENQLPLVTQMLMGEG